jgi:phosphoesterase RecJ-like protein
VIDHHITITYFGDVNVVIADAASAAEVILKLIKRMGIALTGDTATALLTGLISDTQAFRTTNTTIESLSAAMELMKVGAPLMEIIHKAVVSQPFDNIRMLGEGIRNTKLEDGVAYAVLTRKLRQELGLKEERGDGGLVTTLINTNEAKIAVVFTENADGKIEISMRGMPGYDVSQVALEFGGGGHAPAAGCTLPGPMRDVVNQVVPRLRRVIREA